MPSELTKAVRTALSRFVSHREENEADVAIDVLRAIRDEAVLLMERQIIWDTFDSDPFELCKNSNSLIRKQVSRAKVGARCIILSIHFWTSPNLKNTVDILLEFNECNFLLTVYVSTRGQCC